MSQAQVHAGGTERRAAALLSLLLAVSLVAGCRLFRRGHRNDTQGPDEPPAAAVLTTEPQVRGAIDFYREDFNFVVIEFEPGPMPRVGQDLDVERDGHLAGRVRVSGPFKGRRAVATVIEGLVTAGDRVRPRSRLAPAAP